MTGAVWETVHNGTRYLITSHKTADQNGWTRFAADGARINRVVRPRGIR